MHSSKYGAPLKTLYWGFGAITLVLIVGLIFRFSDRETQSAQHGPRGAGMGLVEHIDTLRADAPVHQAPDIHKAARVRANAPVAGNVYKNVKVLNELTVGEFGRTMTAMTEWIAPNESCVYCHVEGNFAADDKYTKIVARRMIEMVRHLNTNWKPHTGETGVTCYTCHRGQGLPPQRWFRPDPATPSTAFVNRNVGLNPTPFLGMPVVSSDPFTTFLLQPVGGAEVRITGKAALVTGPRASVQHAEKTQGLMIHISKSLGVNCTFCHNSRAFQSWEESSPQRVTAWQGLNMVRDVNTQFLEPLNTAFPLIPEGRIGPNGDTAKVNCATCHLGTNKPLKGAQMAKFYPALLTPYVVPAAPAAAASAPAEAASAAQPAETPASAPPAPPEIELLAAASASRPAAVAVAAVAATPAQPAAPTPAPAATKSPAATSTVAAVLPAPAPAPAAAPTLAAVKPATPPIASPNAVAAPATAVAVAAAEPMNCIDIGAAGTKSGARVARDAAVRQVSGSGRLGFYSAPDKSCEMLGVYIQPGDVVEASLDQGGYTAVRYQRAPGGAEVQGWVRTERLALAPRAAATRVAQAAVPAPAPTAPAAPTAPPVALAAASKAPAALVAAVAAMPATPASLQVASGDAACQQAQQAAASGRQPVAPAAARRVVLGSGRLQFHAAPDLGCRQPGVFILAGESVEAVEQFADFTAVRYVNPRTGGEARGWVQSTRLGASARSQAEAPAAAPKPQLVSATSR